MTLPHVTDHAVLRYLERALGLDVESTRRHIALLCAEAVKVKARSVQTHNLSFKIKGTTIVTVAPIGAPPNVRLSPQMLRGRGR